MRGWLIQILMLDQSQNEVPATIFDKVTYHLHPTFANPVRTVKKPPFKIEEEGWGEFDMQIVVHFVGGGERKLNHDLNFRETRYVSDHEIMCPTNKPVLARLLAETGPVPGLEEGAGDKRKATSVDGRPKKARVAGSVKGLVDLEKLAYGLTKLLEDNLLLVVQMVTDNRTSEMSVKNDVEEGEFTMDLYTFPDGLLKSLWEYVKKHLSVE